MLGLCEDLIDQIGELAVERNFELLAFLIYSEYEASGGNQPSDEGSYNSNLSLLIDWQVKDYQNTVTWGRSGSEQADAYDRCVRAFKRCVEAAE